MASQAIQRLRRLLRRGPVTASVPDEAPAPAADEDVLQRHLARLAAEVDRIRAAELALEARCDAIDSRGPAPAATSAPPDLGRIESTVAALQGRVSEALASHASAAIAAKRIDGALAAVRTELAGLAARVAALEQQAGEDREHLRTALAAAGEVQETIAAATRQLDRARDELSDRADELGLRLAGRLAPLYLLSFVALLASLATLAMLFWKM